MRRFITLFGVFVVLQADLAFARLGAQYQLALGNPSDAKSDTFSKTNYLIKRAEYALSYNSSHQQPNWVSWSFTPDDRGSSGRSDNFTEDKTLPFGFARLDGSTFGGGFDRGHMCPSADRTCSPQHNEVTFIMSNIAPQAAGNNRGPWNDLEQYCRTLVTGGQEVLIICGPSGFKGDKTSAGVPVPENFWKIAVVRKEGGTITSSSRVIAVSMPNKNEVQGTSWTDYITSVEQIEKDTGYKFFDTLAASTASNLKVVVDKSATGKPKGIDKEQPTEIASAETKQETKVESAPTPVVAQSPPPPPITLPESQSIVIFKKTDKSPPECRIASVKKSGDAVEIRSDDGKLLVIGAGMVLATAPLPPSGDIQLTKEQVDLALSLYEKSEKTEELKTMLADGRAKWVAIKEKLETPVVVASAPVQTAPDLDEPTAAGVEEPEPVVVRVEAKPETGWRVWVSWVQGFVQKILGR